LDRAVVRAAPDGDGAVARPGRGVSRTTSDDAVDEPRDILGTTPDYGRRSGRLIGVSADDTRAGAARGIARAARDGRIGPRRDVRGAAAHERERRGRLVRRASDDARVVARCGVPGPAAYE